MIIGITGKNGSGKTEVANYLKLKGFEYISLSDILREEAKKRNIRENRENLRNLGNELRKKFGPGILAELALKKIKPDKNYCVDSIRNPNEIAELRKIKNFLLIGIKAKIELRYKRVLDRGRIGDNISFEKFKELEEKENSKEEEKQQLDKCLKIADKIIENNGTIEELHRKIDKILSSLT
ncbi:MAG: hypothetical protein DRP10_04205 [Candidatus Aenigmatarchaeota archaeon]|nr:MAG: hypothetical protein DRP10_04205 [Candidatus Aenigmarchaeota archaeon]